MFGVDLFAGAGGASHGIRLARPGLEMLGLDNDAPACATARAADHPRLVVDVTTVNPRAFSHAAYMHFSPPCQGFSMSGKGAGRRDGERLAYAITEAATRRDDVPELIAEFAAGAKDPLSFLTLEPLRWAAALDLTYITMEQVPTGSQGWDFYAETLRAWGYSAWSGILSAEQYGVPQTRKRAFLIARRDGLPATPPAPTHTKYNYRDPGKLEHGLPRWVSMAEALNWAEPWAWEQAGYHNTPGRPRNVRPMTALSLTVDTRGFKWAERVNDQSGTPVDKDWPRKRPAPTIAGRGLVTHPGANANRFNGATKSRNDGLVVEPWELGVLQSFPHNYPWAGTKTQKFRQIGNAVPPVLMAAVADHLLPGGA